MNRNEIMQRAGAAFSARDFDRAQRDYEHVLRAIPDDLEVMTNLGSVYLARRQPDQARRW